MVEKALTGVVHEANVRGISTRSVNDLVKAFLDRPIKGDWPSLWIDAPI